MKRLVPFLLSLILIFSCHGVEAMGDQLFDQKPPSSPLSHRSLAMEGAHNVISVISSNEHVIHTIATYLTQKEHDSKKSKYIKSVLSAIFAGLSTEGLSEVFTNGLIIQTFFTQNSMTAANTLAAFMYVGMFFPEVRLFLESADGVEAAFRKKSPEEVDCRRKHYTSTLAWLFLKALVGAGFGYKADGVFMSATFGQGFGSPDDYAYRGPFDLGRALQGMASLDSEAAAFSFLRQRVKFQAHDRFQIKEGQDSSGCTVVCKRQISRFLHKMKFGAREGDLTRWRLRQDFANSYRAILQMKYKDLVAFVERLNGIEEKASLKALYDVGQDGFYDPIAESKSHKMLRYVGYGLTGVVFSPLYYFTGLGAGNGVEDPRFDNTWANIYASAMTLYTMGIIAFKTSQILSQLYYFSGGDNPNLWKEDIRHLPTSVPGLRFVISFLSYGFSSLLALPAVGLGVEFFIKYILANVLNNVDDDALFQEERDPYYKVSQAMLMGCVGYAALSFGETDGVYGSIVSWISKYRRHDLLGFLRDEWLQKLMTIRTGIGTLKDEKAQALQEFLNGRSEENEVDFLESGAPERDGGAKDKECSDFGLSNSSQGSKEGAHNPAKYSRGIKAWFIGPETSPTLKQTLERLVPKPTFPEWMNRFGAKARAAKTKWWDSWSVFGRESAHRRDGESHSLIGRLLDGKSNVLSDMAVNLQEERLRSSSGMINDFSMTSA